MIYIQIYLKLLSYFNFRLIHNKMNSFVAFGYLVAISYKEDKYGVVQQTLPEIIRLLLDIKMVSKIL